ncbi:MAG: NADP-dependent oxidoreductase [Steroidobacteraceae bacterium]
MQGAVHTGTTTVVKTVTQPVPVNDEVLIKVRAAGLNPVDWRAPGGENGMGAGGPPPGAPNTGMAGGPPPGGPGGGSTTRNPDSVLGFDAAGIITAIGPGVTNWKVGDAVIAFLDSRGAYAQYAVAPVAALVRKPDKLSFEQAAGIPTVAYAAWAVLVDVAKVGKGQRVLVHGGAGGVGSAAIQIAKARGAYVIATASKANHDYLRSMGADETIDYTTEKFENKVRDIDIVMNTRDADTATRSLPIIKKGGQLVSVSGRPSDADCQAAGVTCAGRSMTGATPIGGVLQNIADLVNQGKYQVRVDKAYPLADIEKAFEDGRQGHTRGKLVLTIP